jgi:hypothetical protein
LLKDKTIERQLNKLADANTTAIDNHLTQIASVARGQIDRLGQFQAKKPADFVPLANALKTFDDVARRNLGLSSGEQPHTQFNMAIGDMPTTKTVLPVQVESQMPEVKKHKA